jgi:ATP-binding cassette subfamily B protein
MTALPTWRHLLRLSRFARGYSVAHALLWGLMNLSTLLPGLIARSFFDALTGAAAIPGGTRGVAVLLVALALGQAVLWLIAGYVEIVFRFLVSALLRRNLLGQMLERPGALALPYPIGETLNRFRDDVDVAEDSLDWTDEIVGQGVLAVVAVAILFATDAGITLALFVPLVLVVAAAHRASAALGRYRAASSQAASEVAGAIGEMLTAVETVRAAGAEDRIVARLRRLNQRRQALTVKDRLATQMLDAITVNCPGSGRPAHAAGGEPAPRRRFDGRATSSSSSPISPSSPSSSPSSVGIWRNSTKPPLPSAPAGPDRRAPAAALTAPAPLHLTGPLPSAAPPAAAGSQPLRLVSATGLSYRHPGTGRGILGVDLSLPQGTLTVVTGRVGAGKTTLLRAFLGLLPPDAGEIRWNGALIDDPSVFLAPPRAAYTAQAPRLFSGTLRRNVLLGVPEDPAVLSGAIRGAMLERDVAALGHGLETVVGTRGVALSGGQVQRAAVARMLAREADLLVIDDVSSALDAEPSATSGAACANDRARPASRSRTGARR